MGDERASPLHAEVDRILWEEWDPIGVNDAPEARDEYAAYVGPIVTMLREGAGAAAIGRYLWSVEFDAMGLHRSSSRTGTVAERLASLGG